MTEVLIKFPTLVLARAAIENGPNKKSIAVRRALLGRQLSLGLWLESLRDVIAPATAQFAQSRLLTYKKIANQFVSITHQGTIRKTKWFELLEKLVTWRNHELGHGVFRIDINEYLNDLEQHISHLNSFLAQHAKNDLWDDTTLVTDDLERLTLRGWRSSCAQHKTAAFNQRAQAIPTILVHKAGSLRLAPYITVRKCRICNKRDVFLYDTRTGRGPRDGFRLLDYRAGHGLPVRFHHEDQLVKEVELIAGEIPFTNEAESHLGDDDFFERSAHRLLEQTALKARYITPSYLHRPFRSFLETREKGIVWLVAPAHTGKTIFVNGIAMPETVGQNTLLGNTCIVSFFIKREYQPWPEQFRLFLIDQLLKDKFGKLPGRQRLPELDMGAKEPAGAFNTFLHQARDLMPQRFDRFIVCLDGLDELPPMESERPGIADFIPRPNDLPPGCFLLLTSRPLAQCPPHVEKVLRDRFPETKTNDFEKLELLFDSKTENCNELGRDYQSLLRDYFDRELFDRKSSEIYEQLAIVSGNIKEKPTGQPLSTRHPSHSSDIPAPLYNRIKDDWRDLTGDSTSQIPHIIWEKTIAPCFDRYDTAFKNAIDKSSSVFLYFAHIISLLRDRDIELEQVGNMPEAGGLYQHYLQQLQAKLGSTSETEVSKPWDLAHRVILLLAANERAHVEFTRCLVAPYRNALFRGMPLDTLATILGEPSTSVRLIFTLFSIQEILATWKGDQALYSRFSLGLKGFSETVAILWPDELAASHRALGEATLDQIVNKKGVSYEGEGMGQLGDYLLANVELSSDPALLKRVLFQNDVESYFMKRSDASMLDSRFEEHIVTLSLLTHLLKQKLVSFGIATVLITKAFNSIQPRDSDPMRAEPRSPEVIFKLAKAFSGRATALHRVGHSIAALHDIGEAITFGQVLSTQQAGQWGVESVLLLMATYQNRATIFDDCGDSIRALEDYDAAIKLGNQSQGRMLNQSPSDFLYALSMAYMNRGIAYANANHPCSHDPDRALQDFDRAADLAERHRRQNKHSWPLTWKILLARIYVRRGSLHDDQGKSVAAIKDFDKAIVLRKDQRSVIEDGPLLEWQNVLGGAFFDRGVTRFRSGKRQDLQKALADFDEAAALREAVRRQMTSDDWIPEWRYNLATVYRHRAETRRLINDTRKAQRESRWRSLFRGNGRFRSSKPNFGGDLEKVFEDYANAIDLYEALKQKLKERFPPYWTSDLALAYYGQATAATALALEQKCESLDAFYSKGTKIIADCNKAIALWKALRQKEESRWPDIWASRWAMVSQFHCNFGKDIVRVIAESILPLIYKKQWSLAARRLIDLENIVILLEKGRFEYDTDIPPPWNTSLNVLGSLCQNLGPEDRVSLRKALDNQHGNIERIFRCKL